MPSTSGDLHSPSKRSSLSLDMWALIIAFVLAVAVKFNIFRNVPW